MYRTHALTASTMLPSSLSTRYGSSSPDRRPPDRPAQTSISPDRRSRRQWGLPGWHRARQTPRRSPVRNSTTGLPRRRPGDDRHAMVQITHQVRSERRATWDVCVGQPTSGPVSADSRPIFDSLDMKSRSRRCHNVWHMPRSNWMRRESTGAHFTLKLANSGRTSVGSTRFKSPSRTMFALVKCLHRTRLAFVSNEPPTSRR
jgi:hypothetical protein